MEKIDMTKPLVIHVGELTFSTFQGKDGQQYWHAKGANGEIFCSSEGLKNAKRSMKRYIALACHQEYRQVIEALVSECYVHDGDMNYTTNPDVLKRAAAALSNTKVEKKEGK